MRSQQPDRGNFCPRVCYFILLPQNKHIQFLSKHDPLSDEIAEIAYKLQVDNDLVKWLRVAALFSLALG